MDVFILAGRKAILQHAHLLERLAEQCGQYGAMQWLDYFLGGSGRHWKKPYAVLIVKPGADRTALKQEDLTAAVLVYELCIFGLRSGAVATDDWEGFRTVVAPPGLRKWASTRATEALIEHGAHIVLISRQAEPSDDPDCLTQTAGGSRDLQYSENRREMSKTTLLLGDSFEETLRKFGPSTRANMRVYRRRLARRMGYEFVPDARQALGEKHVEILATRSLNTTSVGEVMRRFRAARDLPGGFLVGLRRGDGWLSLLGGWRQKTTTVIYFQVNSAGYEKYSLGTIMRSHLLESEVERGTRRLIFYHETNHTMSRAFEKEGVRDILAHRASLRADVLRKVAGLIFPADLYGSITHYGGSNKFLAAAMASHSAKWQTIKAPASGTGIYAD